MTFSFRIPTQPPSVNHSYKIVRQYGRGGKPYMTLAKEQEVLDYQMVAASIAKTARPNGWPPPAPQMIRITYQFHLARDVDCDNLLKALDDAFAKAWDINDRRFLPCVAVKTTGNKEPYVEVQVG